MEAAIAAIAKDYELGRAIDVTNAKIPDYAAVVRFVDTLLPLVFPMHSQDRQKNFADLQNVLNALLSEEEAVHFLQQIPQLRATIQMDVDAAFDGDPAATDRAEIIACYPGLLAVTIYRLAHVLVQMQVPMIPRMMTEYAHSRTGIDIHPGATIGHHFFIDHGTGIVIGETTIIGNFVKIYQGVTLGGLSTRGGQRLRGVKRHPTIEDHVTIYANASILGGETVIGHHTTIGASAFITDSIPPSSTVTSRCQQPQLHSITAKPARSAQ